LAGTRREYTFGALDEQTIARDPFTQFGAWLGEADAAGVPEPNAVTLATATARGAPSARVVLLKDFDARGFVFFTNYDSRKGRELMQNARAALVFLWHALERQVRIEGLVEMLTTAESDAYFAQRPRRSQLAAIAAPQSQVVPNRAALEERYREVEQQYAQQAALRPAHWGGYRVLPQVIEFWQGRRDRLHDRLVFRKEQEQWRLIRLAP
jgi:pyridoxamine 5'-phosphate oxidase